MTEPSSSWKAYAGAAAGGVAVGLLMALLVWKGNPVHMGICGACFQRDVAGAVGLHTAAPVRYIRPEVIGIVLGAMVAALARGEFRSRAGASPFFKLVLGAWTSVGALVFLGCPFRLIQRLGGGDLNALVGVVGLVAGIGLALLLVRTGSTTGRSAGLPKASGYLLPAVMLGLLAALLVRPSFIAFSDKGPGAARAPWWLSLGAAALAGAVMQRMRFCTLGAFRNVVFYRDPRLLVALLAIAASYGAVAASIGAFRLGMEGQPVAHSNVLWNLLGMALAGLSASVAGGCPVRQLVMAGEGDSDSAACIVGMVLGGALAHNFGLVSGPAGPTPGGRIAVVAGLVFCAGAAALMRARAAERPEAANA